MGNEKTVTLYKSITVFIVLVVPIELFSKQTLDFFMALGHFLGMNPQKL